MRPAKLEGDVRAAALKTLKGWAEVKDGAAIAKTYKFKDFIEAFGFMSSAAIIAQVSAMAATSSA